MFQQVGLKQFVFNVKIKIKLLILTIGRSNKIRKTAVYPSRKLTHMVINKLKIHQA